MLSNGRVCVKTAGREAGSLCVIISKEGSKYLVDGLVKRRECNAKHLEPLPKTVKVTKSSSKKEVVDAIVSLGLISSELAEKFLSKKPKEAKEKPVKKKEEKKGKKEIKKEEVKEEKKVEEKKEVKKKSAPKKKKEASKE